MSTQQKILINFQNGRNNLERATISLVLAVTASKTRETALFVSAEAAELCITGVADDLVVPGYEPIKNLLEDYLANQGKIWLCPACAKAKGISESDLVEGVEIAGAPKSMAFLDSGAQLLA
ncbi:MAG: DsrE family protein [Neptuniibacter sp.]